MASIMHWLVPKEEKFFEMLAEQSENALDGAKELKNFVNSYHKFENVRIHSLDVADIIESIVVKHA